jgi:hypothetical protein
VRSTCARSPATLCRLPQLKSLSLKSMQLRDEQAALVLSLSLVALDLTDNASLTDATLVGIACECALSSL